MLDDSQPKSEIYALLDPRTARARYIGKARDARKRLASHFRDSRRKNSPVHVWIRELSTLGLKPLMLVILREVGDWASAEREIIAKLRVAGYDLLNVAAGGNEPYCSPVVRAQNGRKVAAMRASYTPEQLAIYRLKKRVGENLKRGWINDEARAKLREAAVMCPELFACFAEA